MICLDLDPFDDRKCDVVATWLMTVSGAGLLQNVSDRPLCDYHKRVNERLHTKYYPNARVTFTRIPEKPDA